MEHTILPPDQKHIQITYNAREKGYYDHRGFGEYPTRQGYSKHDLSGENGFGGRNAEDVKQFFQTWLFFGLIIEFFAAFGMNVTTEQFLAPRTGTEQNRIVDTSSLPDVLVKLKESWAKPKDQPTATTVSQMLTLAQDTLDRFCTYVPKSSTAIDTSRPSWPVSDRVAMSIMAICSTLRAAAADILDMVVTLEVDKGTATSSLLRSRLEQKWCKYDVAVTMDNFEVDGHYYLAAAPGQSDEYLAAHGRCTEDGCVFVMDEKGYLTRHAPEFHKPGCEERIGWGGQLGPERTMHSWIDAVCQIIDRDATPYSLWVAQYRKTWSVEYHTTGKRKPPYVAISHIWSDGLGNPVENSLPECQLERIQGMVDKINYPGRNGEKTVGFWMDTLCVPVQDQLKAYRKKSIANMRHIYRNAVAVLVLDPWLQQIPSTATTPEILARLCQSAWLRRLWTHQEGFLAKNVYYQFKDQALHMKDIEERRIHYEDELKAKGIYSKFLSDAQIQAIEPYSMLKMAIEYEDDGDGVRTLPEDAFEALVLSLELRRTTRAGDETLCLSSILSPLGLDVNTYLDIVGENVAERRMVQFYQDIQRFDPRIVFNTYPRLNIDGFKWAPTSLIGHRSEELMRRGEHNEGEEVDVAEEFAQLKQIDGKWGLPVKYPGFMFRLAGAAGVRTFAISHGSATDGTIGNLLNSYLPATPAKLLEKAASKTASRFGGVLPSKVLPYLPGRTPTTAATSEHLLVRLSHVDNQWHPDPHESYGLIMACSLKQTLVGSRAIAVLGSVVKGASAAGEQYLRLSHVCHATVQKRGGGPPSDVDCVTANELGEETEWFVV
ncbi:hypothetical protein G647_01375 [Cladophialophora carrionii CBS 160.54]|uniref:Heterokaryon incompatibility domain-containing protein n=1 Tax=Cladophialophora carrionii CBS 160.54 TaxID=1279043 RepID=V9DRK2_9EURO|nr:uncharacterized protein G647_01375 [Cladophialophora carrionii CBS 160.54]ETI28923.1 hypothetical protein G647_01375 [Cladophialophora carrionii CBS 160.54]